MTVTVSSVRLVGYLMACPPGNCAAWGAFRLCKPLPPIVIDGSYSADELQMLWFCWRARSTGEYGGNTPVDLGFDTPGLIDISGKTNIAKIIEYCDSRGTLVRQFTNFSRFGVKFNLPNFRAAGSFSSWSGGIFGGATSPGGGGGSGGGGDDGPIGPDPTGVGGGSGGGGAATCICIPDDPDLLTVAVCTELDCGIEDPKVEITVCGGTPPYSWVLSGFTGSPTIIQSGTNNHNVIAQPEDSTNNSPLATAYARVAHSCVATEGSCCGFTFNLFNWRDYNCGGEPINSCQTVTDDGAADAGCNEGNPSNPACLDGECEEACTPPDNNNCNTGVCGAAAAAFKDTSSCAEHPEMSGGAVCDKRTQSLKDDGCIPCSLQLDGAIITVTDDVGAQVVTVIAA